jgi:hypothetical protein
MEIKKIQTLLLVEPKKIDIFIKQGALVEIESCHVAALFLYQCTGR